MSDVDTRFRLSKSKIAAFEHCAKRLWLQIHRRNAARFDPDTLARFEVGHMVGAIATTLVPGGVMVEAEPDIQAALNRTAELVRLKAPVPIFEATFQFRDVLVRVDILEPAGEGMWRAIEVKASSKLRAYQLADLATQIWVMQGCGLGIYRATIRHLQGPIDWHNPDPSSIRFVDTDVTTPIRRVLATRSAVANDARRAIRGPEVHRAMGNHCQRPFACEFQAHCRALEAVPLLARAGC